MRGGMENISYHSVEEWLAQGRRVGVLAGESTQLAFSMESPYDTSTWIAMQLPVSDFNGVQIFHELGMYRTARFLCQFGGFGRDNTLFYCIEEGLFDYVRVMFTSRFITRQRRIILLEQVLDFMNDDDEIPDEIEYYCKSLGIIMEHVPIEDHQKRKYEIAWMCFDDYQKALKSRKFIAKKASIAFYRGCRIHKLPRNVIKNMMHMLWEQREDGVWDICVESDKLKL